MLQTRNSQLIALCVIGAVAALLRCWLVFTHPGYLGIDGGAYFISRDMVLGVDTAFGVAFNRPPLAPGWLLVPFTSIWGDMLGYDIWSIVFSLIPLLPAFWLISKRLLLPWQAVIALAFYAFDLLAAEMLVSGALPLIGFGLILLAFVGINDLQKQWQWSSFLLIAVSVGLVPWINQTAAGIALFALPIFVFALLYFSRDWTWTRRIVLAGALGALLAAPSLFWYGDVWPGSPMLRFPGPLVYPAHWTDSSWLQMLVAVPAGLFVAWKAKLPMLRAVGVLTVFEGLMLVWLSNDEAVINVFYRARYFVMPLLTICLTWVVANYGKSAWEWAYRTFNTPIRLKDYSRVLTVGAAGFLALLITGYAWQFNNQAYYSDAITPDMMRVMEYLPEDNQKGIIGNGFIFALWIASLEQVPVAWTFSTLPPRLYQEQYTHTQCIMGWRKGCDPAESAQEIDMGWVLIDKRFPYINERMKNNNYYGAPLDTWSTIEKANWLTLTAASGTARLYKIGG